MPSTLSRVRSCSGRLRGVQASSRARRLAGPIGLSAVLGAVTIAASLVSTTVGAQPGVTGAFIDGWPGAARPYAPVSLQPTDTLVAHPSNSPTVYIESDGPGPIMSFLFSTGNTSALTVGSYATASGATSQISPTVLACSTTQNVEFDVLEIERDSAGIVTRFAADFAAVCPNWQPPLPEAATGSVRLNSTIGFHAFSIAPVRVVPWEPDTILPDQAVGTSASTTAFTVTNTGSLPLDVDVADPTTDDLSIGAGSCDGTVIAPGATCEVMATFGPTEPGPQDFPLTLLTPELPRSQRALAIRALGTTTTTTTVTVDPLFQQHESGGDPARTLYTITVEPARAVGTSTLSTSCGVSGSGGSVAAQTPPGNCEAWATFTGNDDSGYLASESGVVSFVQPARSSVYGIPIAGNWITGNTVTIEVVAGAGNAGMPTDGKLTLLDEETDEVLGTEPVSAGDRTMLVDVVTMTPGLRRMRAVFDESADMVGSSSPVGYVVEEDASPPNVWIRPSDGAGWTMQPEIVLDVSAFDASNEITALELSNDGLNWKSLAFDESVPWSLVDPAYGGSPADGPRTIHAQVMDFVGNWSDVATWGITLDRGMPEGSVSIASGSPYVIQASVPVAVPATDPISPIAAVALSNDGTTWTTRTYAASQTWTLPGANGTRTVHAKWRDKAGNWSLVEIDTVVLDTAKPAGAVTIAGGAGYTRSGSVMVGTAATDVGSGLSQVALSNDGTTWTTRTYGASQAWTLPATNGNHTVYAKWRDKAGNWSAVKTDSIMLDTVAPTVTAPRRGFVVDTAISSGRISLRVPWSGSDATSGIARYELAQSTDGGAWTIVSTTLTSPVVTRSLAPLHTYRFQVRAIDTAGNTGAWATGATFRISRYSEFNSAITYSGSWTTVSNPAYWGGGAKKSSTAGAKASLTFTGRSIAWVARMGPDRGKAQVYVNGSHVATVDLYSAAAKAQRVVWVGSWTTASQRKVTVRVAGTTGRPRIDLDALVTAN